MEDPSLIDPDSNLDSKYNWDENFQRHIASLIISDKQFLLQSLDLIQPKYFKNKAHSALCKFAFDFFKKYRIIPKKDFIVQEFKTNFKDDKSLTHYLTEINVLFDYFKPGLDSRDYLLDKILFFAKIQGVRKAFQDSLELISKDPESEDTWSKVYESMRKSMQIQQNFELGLDYLKSIKDRYIQKEEEVDNNDRYIIGLPTIDNNIGGGGFSIGEIFSVVAASGVGKSILLSCLTSTNLLRGKKGLYISLELSEDKVADRMDAILSGLPIRNLCANKHNLFENIANLEGIDKDCEIGPLLIKQFAAGTASVNTIKAYISQLKFQGFIPNFVIIDYVGEMALHPDVKTPESRERTVRELRAMALEEEVFVATAMQPNRDGKKDSKSDQGRLDDDHLADSFGQIRPLDGCISLNQNDNEKFLGIGRAYVIKQRDGESRYQIYLKFDKENLRITELHIDQYKKALNSLKEYASDEVKIDMVVGKKTYKPKAEGDDGSGLHEATTTDAYASFKENMKG